MPTNPFYEPKPKTRKTRKAKATRNPARKAPNPATDAAKPKTTKKPKQVPLTSEERRERTRARAAEHRRNTKKSGLCRDCRQPAIPGQTRCPECVDKHRQARQAQQK